MYADLRLALRHLAKSPGFITVAVVSLALGLGASTAVFSLVNAILLRLLAVPNPHELRVLQWSGATHKFNRFNGSQDRSGPGVVADAFSYPMFEALRERCAEQAEFFGYTGISGVSRRSERPVIFVRFIVNSVAATLLGKGSP